MDRMASMKSFTVFSRVAVISDKDVDSSDSAFIIQTNAISIQGIIQSRAQSS